MGRTARRIARGGVPAAGLVVLCALLLAGGEARARGGGGCFLAGTPVLRADGTAVAIETLRPGDAVRAFDADGAVVPAEVREVLSVTADGHLVITAGDVAIAVTAAHPFYAGDGAFREAASLQPGDRVFAFDGEAGLEERTVTAVRIVDGPVPVFNLRVDAPHTFFAAGIAVHNKGGGGGGGGGHSSGGGSHFSGGSRSYGGSRSTGGTGSGEGDWIGVVFGLGILGVIVWLLLRFARRKGEGNLDFVYPEAQVAPKAAQTRKLLDFLARQDDSVAADRLEALARDTFLKLQECWSAREYGPMQARLMPDLYALHCRQLEGLRRTHEINRLDGLKVDRVDLVNVRYTLKPEQREFTALITATARDTYVDDRTNAFLRGDAAPAQFQEFWTFQRRPAGGATGAAWLLRQVEQTRESRALKDENFFEQFTDGQLRQLYGAPVEKTGAAGPWLEKEVLTRAVKIERMLNFLAMTDRLWQQLPLQERAREVFLRVHLALEAGAVDDEVAAMLFPDVAASLRGRVEDGRRRGIALEFRNLCVRKVEILLVRNRADNREDEVFFRIGAHAQRVVRRGDAVVSQDPDVTFFETYWTFGRRDGAWKLKEVLPPSVEGKLLGEENVDEESSAQQVQWYYTKKRAM